MPFVHHPYLIHSSLYASFLAFTYTCTMPHRQVLRSTRVGSYHDSSILTHDTFRAFLHPELGSRHPGGNLDGSQSRCTAHLRRLWCSALGTHLPYPTTHRVLRGRLLSHSIQEMHTVSRQTLLSLSPFRLRLSRTRPGENLCTELGVHVDRAYGRAMLIIIAYDVQVRPFSECRREYCWHRYVRGSSVPVSSSRASMHPHVESLYGRGHIHRRSLSQGALNYPISQHRGSPYPARYVRVADAVWLNSRCRSIGRGMLLHAFRSS
ncbi:hypothetical protein BC628DRAFT_1081495 [Trametes gibbosa]|nr:hypothetical protein BC628DRAFT_1081495 [Trametes gibbosa]